MLVIRHDIRVKRELERLSRKAERRPCGFVTRGDHPLRSKFRRFLRLINKRSRSSFHGYTVRFFRSFVSQISPKMLGDSTSWRSHVACGKSPGHCHYRFSRMGVCSRFLSLSLIIGDQFHSWPPVRLSSADLRKFKGFETWKLPSMTLF